MGAFQSLLVQVSFKTRDVLRVSRRQRFQSLLVQVSFKTRALPQMPCGRAPFQSLLVQVSFKTPYAVLTKAEGLRFNPFSFRSPSKRRRPSWSSGTQRFQSLLVQVSFKTPRMWTLRRRLVSIPSRSGLLQNDASPDPPFPSGSFQSLLVQVSFKTPRAGRFLRLRRFNPFSFRSPSKRGVLYFGTRTQFQSLLVQVSFKTR